MLVRYSDWVRPTDDRYAFPLLPPASEPGAEGFVPERPEPGVSTPVDEVARTTLGDEVAERFSRRVSRWSGPEDETPSGEKPYEGAQTSFDEAGARSSLGSEDVEAALCGSVQVYRDENGQVDYLLRDHHMIDVALYHYRTTGDLPTGLFHADRHSDWCTDTYLEARRPAQAATWWKLFHGLKRPEDGAPVLEEAQVAFATARAEHEPWMSGRPDAGSAKAPSFLDPTELGWEDALSREASLEADWVSLDLDYFQPSPQLRLSRGLLRDERFHRLMSSAKVRVFVLSPQFTLGGDLLPEWTVQGRMHSSLRLVNLLRALPPELVRA